MIFFQKIMGCWKYYGMGTPPPVWTDTQSENITSRHPSDAGGNKTQYYFVSDKVVRVVKTIFKSNKDNIILKDDRTCWQRSEPNRNNLLPF